MKYLIINDLHLGVTRQGGTTPVSRIALSNWMFEQFQNLLKIPHDNMIILGDIFDRRIVPPDVLYKTLLILEKEKSVIFITGNHDLSGINDHSMSSLQLLHKLLPNSTLINTPTQLDNFYIIPHLFNQDEFDGAIANVPAETILLLHCNIDNHFAISSDTALNLSLDQIKDLDRKNVQVIAGHEHAQRQCKNITVIGNQFPSSIADCVSGPKRCLVLENGEITSIPTWNGDDYLETSTLKFPDHYNFINMTGSMTISECMKMTKEINTLRKRSNAFIIRNGIDVVQENQEITSETITSLNILKLFIEQLPEDVKDELRKKLEV